MNKDDVNLDMLIYERDVVGDEPREAGSVEQSSHRLVREHSMLHVFPGRLAEASSLPPSGIDFNAEVERFEKELLRAALRQCNGVQYKAAQLLGLKVTTINMKLSRYGIACSEFKQPASQAL